MLPDLPDLKKRARCLLTGRMRVVARLQLGPLAEAKHMPVFEGDRVVTIRHDGSSDEIDFRTLESGVTIRPDEIPDLDPVALIKKSDEAAKDIGEQQFLMALGRFAELSEAGSGMVRRGEGEFGVEQFFSILEELWVDFNQEGIPELQIICGEMAAEKFREVLHLIDKDPALKARFDDIMDRKRVEYRARQAHRQLVG